jgi:hypothetical protein
MNGEKIEVREMPSQARLDIAGTLHHIMLKGIEKKQIFDDDVGSGRVCQP